MTATNSIQDLFNQVEAASASFLAGDSAPVMSLWSRASDVSIFGGSGSYAQGWSAVEPRLSWAAKLFHGGHGSIELITMGKSGDLAYMVYIERGETREERSDETRQVALRVTRIYRQEDGAWKIIHRHADPIMESTVPALFKKEGS